MSEEKTNVAETARQAVAASSSRCPTATKPVGTPAQSVAALLAFGAPSAATLAKPVDEWTADEALESARAVGRKTERDAADMVLSNVGAGS